MKRLSHSVIEKIHYYVYILIDPRDNRIFYIGKGKGNRVYCHLNGAIKGEKPSDKIILIQEIIIRGFEIQHYIIRHGLTEKEALEVEGALIDLSSKSNLTKGGLTNIVLGHNSKERGIMDITEININYDAENVEIEDKVVLININNLYKFGISKEELYEATKKSWVLNKDRAGNADYVFSHYHGIIREVYEIDSWDKSIELENKNDNGEKVINRRYEFIGKIASQEIRDKYLHKSIKKYFKQGSQNPIKYVNI